MLNRVLTATAMLLVTLSCVTAHGMQASNLTALYRSGQTFLVWDEVTGITGETYRLYRYTNEIEATSFSSATYLSTIAEGSSLYATEADRVESNVYFRIEDMGMPLSSNEGLFVYTMHDTGVFYYAVTVATNGWENTNDFTLGNSLTTGIVETEADPLPVLYRTNDEGTCRTYTQFMDYHRWNPTFNGYAYNYSVTLPEHYTNSVAWPLTMHLVAYGNRYSEPKRPKWDGALYLEADDPKAFRVTENPGPSWHYGYNASWDFKNGAAYPTNGIIVNFTEQRHLRALYDTMRDAYYNVDTNRIYVWGESMGASGSISFALRYPNVFAAAWCWQPMMDYGHISTWFWMDFARKWGRTSVNLPIENRGRFASALTNFNGVGVYDWMNQFNAMTNLLLGRDAAYFFIHHGTNDGTIPWPDQGAPTVGSAYAGRRGFIAMVDGSTHEGMRWKENDKVAGPNWNISGNVFRMDTSYPAFSWASCNGPVPPVATSMYNQTLEWSCSWHDFAGDIVDTSTNYIITLRSTNGNQTADVTLRRLQAFPHKSGTRVTWRNRPIGESNHLQIGTLAADACNLITVTNFIITTNGNQLIMDGDTAHDTDGDTMPDYWEVAYGLNPTNPADGGATDSDGDGVSNIHEYPAGTDPWDANSLFYVSVWTGDSLTIPANQGFVYRMQATPDLQCWTDAWSIVTAQVNRVEWNVDMGGMPMQAYRVIGGAP